MDPEAEALLDPLALAGHLRQSSLEVPPGQRWKMDAFEYVSGGSRVRVKRKCHPPLWAAWARQHRATTWRFNSAIHYGDPLLRLLTDHPDELTRGHVLELMLCDDERRDALLEIVATRRPELFIPGPTLPLTQRSPAWCLRTLDRLTERCAVQGISVPEQTHPVLGALLWRVHGTNVADLCISLLELAHRSQAAWRIGNIQLRRLLLPFPARVRAVVAQEFTQRFTGRIPMIATARTPQLEQQLDRINVPPYLGSWRLWSGVTAQRFPATLLFNAGGKSLDFRLFVEASPIKTDFPFELCMEYQYTDVVTWGLAAYCLWRTGSELGLEIHLPIDRWAALVSAQPALFAQDHWFVQVHSDRVADFHRALMSAGARLRILAPQHSVDLWMLDAAERGAIDLHILSPRVSDLDAAAQAGRWAAECEQSLLRSQ